MKIKNHQIVPFFVLLLTVWSCSNGNNESNIATSEPTQQTPLNLAEGFQLTENNCFSCHSPDAAHGNRVAPPMEAVKKHYIGSATTQAQFTEDLISFLNNPSADNSKMPGAVKRFGLMPKMGFNEEQLTKIASYIFNTELEKPDWFEKHYHEEKRKYGSNVQSSPIETGQGIAMKTKGVLGSNLLNAINTKGTVSALAFCATRAIPLTDSMSVALNARVKRVSDLNRNPENGANQNELAYIQATKQNISQGLKPTPQLNTEGNKILGYYPIMTGPMCMQCHGQPETEVLPNTLAEIQKRYPDDKAMGYSIDELRGIWVVEWENN